MSANPFLELGLSEKLVNSLSSLPFDFGQRAELIAEEHTAVLELAAVLIGNGKYLTVELLDNE